jgi:hypothetical protein
LPDNSSSMTFSLSMSPPERAASTGRRTGRAIWTGFRNPSAQRAQAPLELRVRDGVGRQRDRPLVARQRRIVEQLPPAKRTRGRRGHDGETRRERRGAEASAYRRFAYVRASRARPGTRPPWTISRRRPARDLIARRPCICPRYSSRAIASRTHLHRWCAVLTVDSYAQRCGLDDRWPMGQRSWRCVEGSVRHASAR